MMIKYYKLDDHIPQPTENIVEAFSGDRHVANTVFGDVRISTVFLGLDHSWGVGPPLLFETMIFGGEHDQYQERCSTWKQAEAQHKKACALCGKLSMSKANPPKEKSNG